MMISWLYSPYIDLSYVATRLYEHSGRNWTHKLRAKMNGKAAFEQWEIQRLEKIKLEMIEAIKNGISREISTGF